MNAAKKQQMLRWTAFGIVFLFAFGTLATML